LDGLLEQPIDLGGELAAGGVAVLGVVGVAGAAARDRRQQVLVVIQADADRGAGDAGPLRASGELRQPIVVGHALVRVAVGEQHQRCA
jgi:hypothetical protein